MNKEVIELTRKMGLAYVHKTRLTAEIHILQEQIWAARAESFSKKKEVKNGKPRYNRKRF